MHATIERLLAGDDAVLLDGATGTELERRGYKAALPLWTAEAAERAPDLLRDIHREYLEAGADIVTANTFRTTAHTFRKLGREAAADALTARSVAIAREACKQAGRGLVAGSMATIEDSYDTAHVPPAEVLQREHAAKAQTLADSGVDLLLVETMGTTREMVAAAEAALATGLPVLVSWILDPDRPAALLSGESFDAALQQVRPLHIRNHGIAGFLVNCAPRTTALAALERLRTVPDPRPIGAYPNLGAVDSVLGWKREPGIDAEAFATWALEAQARGARIFGGCCGTTPADLAAMHRVLRHAPGSKAGA